MLDIVVAVLPSVPAVAQAAQHALYAPEWVADWPDEDRRSHFVHDIPRAEIPVRAPRRFDSRF